MPKQEMKETSKNTQARKFLVTENNYDTDMVKGGKVFSTANTLKGLEYACLSEEIGLETKTPHIHIFLCYKNPKLFSTIKNLFPKAHIDLCRGTCSQNRDYVFKKGKWEKDPKKDTSIPGTQSEYGEMPEEKYELCPKPELAFLYSLIKEGKTNAEILEDYPEYMFDITHIERCRLMLRQEEYKDTYRNLKVTYIFGATGTGKTRGVMEEHGYSNVFRVTDYLHPFDTYQGEEVLLLEEFNSSFRIQDVLNYLDGYPLKLPARYSDKTACYKKVYITTNIALEKQYPVIQEEHSETWGAFLRRIDNVIWYKSQTDIREYESVEAYMNRDKEFQSVTEAEIADIPFK